MVCTVIYQTLYNYFPDSGIFVPSFKTSLDFYIFKLLFCIIYDWVSGTRYETRNCSDCLPSSLPKSHMPLCLYTQVLHCQFSVGGLSRCCLCLRLFVLPVETLIILLRRSAVFKEVLLNFPSFPVFRKVSVAYSDNNVGSTVISFLPELCIFETCPFQKNFF
jgi:hypothetical protein